MESLSPQVVVAAKLHILNPNEFDLWKMRIEQVVDGVVQPVAPTTTEQILAKKNELKARGTLLMALPDKHQLKFNIHKDAKSLMEAIEKRFGGNKETKKVQKTLLKKQYENFIGSSSESLDQIHDRLQKIIRQLEILVSAVTSVYAASTKVPVSALPNVDNLSNAEMDLKWQMAMLTIRARRFLQRIERNLGANGTTSIGFVMSKVECYNCHKRGHFARKCRSPRDTRNKDTKRRNVPVETSTSNALVSQCDGVGSYDWSFQGSDSEVAPCSKACSKAYTTLQSHYDNLTNKLRKSQFDVLSYKTGLESIEARLVVYQQNENMFEEDIKLLKLDVMLRDNALIELRKKFKKAEKERDDSESDVSLPTSPVHDRYKSEEGYHAIPPPYTGTFMPHKPNLVFHDAPTASETVPTVLNVSDSKHEYEGEPMPTQKAPSFVQTFEHVKTPRASVKPVEHPTPAENLRKYIPKSRGHRHSWNRKACFVCKSLTHLIKVYDYYEKKMVQKPGNPQQALKDKGIIDNGCSRHMTGNISYLSDVKEINGGYVAFGGNPKGGKITCKGKIKTGKLDFDDVYFIKELKFNLFSVSQMRDKKNSVLFIDTKCVVLSFDFKLLHENHVLLRVPRENNMYNVDLNNIVPLGDLTCLFAKATLDESNLWHRRLGHINFKTMNKLVKCNLVRGLPSKVFENNHTCVACKKGKQHRASCKSKPVNILAIYLS
nr:ribonuclease H-like domain-containing protein [Tanacetum cinerariifolium]